MSITERGKELFRRYCGLRGYRCDDIDTSRDQGIRTPDLEVWANGSKIIVEAKDLNANEEETRRWRETRAGRIVAHGREPGKRARKLIESARGQLRQAAEADVPTVVLLYDNVLVDGTRPYPGVDLFGPIGPTDIDIALYGLWQANVRIHADGTSQSLGDTRSRWRLMQDRQIISAVLAIYEHHETTDPFVIAYHNFWARTPLPRNVFDGKNDRHLAKVCDPDLRPDNWSRI